MKKKYQNLVYNANGPLIDILAVEYSHLWFLCNRPIITRRELIRNDKVQGLQIIDQLSQMNWSIRASKLIQYFMDSTVNSNYNVIIFFFNGMVITPVTVYCDAAVTQVWSP